MTAPVAHRIRRQRWAVRTATATEAFAMRAWLRESWEGELLPAIERAFDRAAAGEEVVHVPRLEIRLSIDAGTDLRARLPELLEQGVAYELSALIARRGPTGASPTVERRTNTEDRVATLRHYLRTGSLPWAAANGRTAPEIAAELRATARRELPRLAGPAPPESHGAAIRDAFFRLLHLLGDEAAASLVVVAPNIPARWSAAIARLLHPDHERSGEAGHETSSPALHLRLAAAAALLAEARAAAVPDDDGAIVAVVRGAVSAGELAALEPLLRARPSSEPPASEGASPPKPASPMTARDGASIVSSSHAAARTGARGWPTPVEAEPPAPTPPALESPPLLAGTAPDDHPLAVANAGLVILHPYVERLFAATGIASNGTLPDASRPRGAALLHWLATGSQEIHELELGLVKLLVGVSPDASFPVADGLVQPADVEECTALLAAVVEHWSILGRTSVAGLRTSFLQRAALLRRVEHGWSLHPEPAPYDVLLDHLPWSFSVVRLPWMPQPLHTEWTTR